MMTNFLGPLYITKALLPTLRKNASPGSPSRVICTGSKLEKRSTLESGTKEDDVRGLTNEYKLFQAYANSKHALHLCTDALITEEKEIVCHTCSPGMVNSRLNRFANPALLFFSWPLRKLLLKTPEQGAKSLVWAATSREAGEASQPKFYDSNQPLPGGGFGETRGASTEKGLGRRVLSQAIRIIDEIFT